MPDTVDLGATLKEYRDQTGLSIRATAELVGVSHTLIARWEKNEKHPQPWALDLLAKAYDVNVYEKFLLFSEAGYLPEDFPDVLLDLLMQYAMLPPAWARAADRLLAGMAGMLGTWNIQQELLLEDPGPRRPPTKAELAAYWEDIAARRYHRRDAPADTNDFLPTRFGDFTKDTE